ncbi:MAG: sigma 54-interacting transcriptional regulator [bacterium]|nr:sigma 54-interacting transcriptional regulator [bacterium]
MSVRILIIDDEESIRFTFHRFLKAAGYSVATVAGCKDALERLDAGSFDLVYADIILEDGTGIDILREIKARRLNCPVIIITGDPMITTATESIRLGAFDYIAKPINQESLLTLTRNALKYKAAYEEKERYRANLEAIFHSVGDAIITVDEAMVLTELNEAATTLCSFTRGDIGKPFATILAGSCEGSCAELLKETIANGKPRRAERMECAQKGRSTRILNLQTYPLLDSQSQTRGVVLVIHDDTRVVELTKKVAELRRFHRIIGKSGPMQRVYSLIHALAKVQTTVLITGESGTGKELVAEALHFAGERGHKPLVKINCSALPENLLEAEMFGHVKGAFTGAISDNEGRFQKADGGTIFFDEIGEISQKIQVKLLRVLEESEFERVGSSVPTKVDVRLIAATNRDLQERVSSGELREDLYYRLKVVEIRLPPLRDRHGDIPLLVEHFRAKFNAKFKKNIEAISADVLSIFCNYSWPGNVRELKHAMEHAFVMCNHTIITCEHLPQDFIKAPILQRSGRRVQGNHALETLEALNKTGWNKTKAARLLGINRVTLYRRIKKFNLKEDAF